ncbi:MAG: rRNA maturation RNase YbeY [bacterium]|nr:rRNA maturation RNase YbeY [bacterium]
MTNEVAVVALEKRYKKLERDLANRTKKILLFLKQDGVKLEIYLVGSARIRKLNLQYRGEDAVTNVLAYEAPKDFPRVSPRLLGEIYLCPPYIEKRGEDIVSLLTHGILHLMGFDHVNVGDRMTMEKTEERLSAWLNR